MAFEVFISHSTGDESIVHQVAEFLRANGIEAHLSERYLQPGVNLSQKIMALIDRSDCVIVFLTAQGKRSEWVLQEIGYAKGKGKLIIPIVEEGVFIGGFLMGSEYVSFKRDEPLDAINRLALYLRGLAVRKEEEGRRKAILAGIILFFGLLGLAAAASKK